ncbi:hypothetical protein LSH36_592g01009 [Paralvinella palmiformis]|uniref:Cyclic nucleotide-binding domain-containing protein n=1 Tax=Paralvinella palmiformis TaxID=53620 RepID=A0AAD9J587_9ANNE|nr:hypothetical protein LSH36_592g01009 [Paralvinella palmiformis]
MNNVNASVRNAVNILALPSTINQRRRQRQKHPDDTMRLVGILATRWLTETCRLPKPVGCRPEYGKITSPYIRFRRIARAVALMTKVCKICKRIVYESVSSEDWFKMIGKFVEGDDKFFEASPTNKPRPFITFITDEDKGEMIQLVFDKSEFSRENRSDLIVITLASANKRHARNIEVRTRTENPVTAARVIQKADDKKKLKELKPGDRFGERDLICGSTRTATIVTKTTVEVLSVHMTDYRAIFNMADDSNNPRYLDICRNDIVFHHFPLKKLRENPGTWAVLSYKFGRLMVKDSNDMEWIYVIKSGEARIIKHLETTVNNPDDRRKRLREKQKHDKNFLNMQMIDFLSDKRSMTSHYKVDAYRPRALTSTGRRSLKSAASVMTSRSEKSSSTVRGPNGSRVMANLRPHSQPMNNFRTRKSSEKDLRGSQTARQDSPKCNVTIQLSKVVQSSPDIQIEEIQDPTAANEDEIEAFKEQSPEGATFIQTGIPGGSSGAQKRTPRKGAGQSLRIPPFVNLESLHAGQVFGFRSCLDEEERGPSVSLVSGGCEVLQINKKFFLTHADEAILGLIKVKYKAFPTEEEMLDRLDASLQWQEYKHNTVLEFLMKKRKNVTDYPSLGQVNV